MRMLFAQIPNDIDAVVALVKREVTEECGSEVCPVFPVLDQCANDAVMDLWGSRIKAFVPLLALRRVRSCIRNGTCDPAEW
jgi:hypothetical protein